MGNVGNIFPAVITAGKGLGFVIAEPFQFHPAFAASGDQLRNLLPRKPFGAELDGRSDIELLLAPLRDDDACHLAESRGKPVIENIPAAYAGFDGGKLGAQQNRAKMVHSSGIVRREKAHLLEHLLGRDGAVPAIEHVGPGRYDGAGGDHRVIGCQEPTFTGIHMFVGLGREGGRLAEIARFPVPPAGPHGVGAILDQADIQPVADVRQPVHVGDMPAHVRQQKKACAGFQRLGLEIGHVDVIVGIDIHQDSHAADIVDRPGHWCQRVGVGQHLVARHDAACPQRKLHGVSARGAGNTVVGALPLGIFAFQLAGFVLVAVSQIVAVKAAALHDFDSAFDGRGRDWFLLREGFGESCPGCHGIPRLKSPA